MTRPPAVVLLVASALPPLIRFEAPFALKSTLTVAR
jgi:hypothetical protein